MCLHHTLSFLSNQYATNVILQYVIMLSSDRLSAHFTIGNKRKFFSLVCFRLFRRNILFKKKLLLLMLNRSAPNTSHSLPGTPCVGWNPKHAEQFLMVFSYLCLCVPNRLIQSTVVLTSQCPYCWCVADLGLAVVIVLG